jgi:hypothetical protein
MKEKKEEMAEGGRYKGECKRIEQHVTEAINKKRDSRARMTVKSAKKLILPSCSPHKTNLHNILYSKGKKM